MTYKIVPVEDVESALDDLDPGTALVIGSLDGVRAVKAAKQVTGNRTAVFVGNLAPVEDAVAADPSVELAAAAEMGSELFRD